MNRNIYYRHMASYYGHQMFTFTEVQTVMHAYAINTCSVQKSLYHGIEPASCFVIRMRIIIDTNLINEQDCTLVDTHEWWKLTLKQVKT